MAFWLLKSYGFGKGQNEDHLCKQACSISTWKLAESGKAGKGEGWWGRGASPDPTGPRFRLKTSAQSKGVPSRLK